MKRASQVFMFVGLMLTVAAQAQAQGLKWEDRGFLNVNYGAQNKAASDLTSTSTFSKYDETGQVSSAQTIESSGGMIDVAAGFRAFGNFGIGAGFNTLSKKGSGTLTAKVPHPIFYDQPRTATATVDNLEHKETAFHVMALFVLPVSDKFDVAVSAGPTFFSLEQSTLATPEIGTDIPPYTSVALTSVTMNTTKANKVGFNAGLDATFRLAKYIGVGGYVRYAGATVDIEPVSGQTVSVNVGGIQFGGGLRFRF